MGRHFNVLGGVPLYRHSPDSRWLWGTRSPVRAFWATVNTRRVGGRRSKQSGDCAKCLELLALPARNRALPAGTGDSDHGCARSREIEGSAHATRRIVHEPDAP